MSVPRFLRGRRGAFIAVGSLAFLVLLFVGLPLAALFEQQADDRDAALAQLTAYREQEARKPALQAQLASLQEGAKSVPGLVSASSASLAQAQLQGDMKVLIDHNNGNLLSAQLLPPTKVKGFDLIAIEYDMTIPLSHVGTLLYAVETHTPYYFVDSADLVMPPNWRPTSAIQDPSMEVRWTIHAYRWSGSK
ncbi:MAG TPA: type II secretion system protein GspM [Rhizomicrobium sp.]|jgi:hypothetical protein